MTTESKQHTRPGVTVLLGAAVAGVVVVGLLTVVAALVEGSAAAWGVAAGGLTALVVFALGTAVVHAVAGLVPAASMMVALLTYTLQVVVMALVVVGLGRSGLAGESVSRGGFAVGVIVTTIAWMIAQIWQATHLRLPAYDLPAEDDGAHPEAGAR